MKRILLILTAVVFAISLMTSQVFAGSHGGGRHYRHGRFAADYRSNTRAITVCSEENCTLTGSHAHNGTTYYAHYYGDGHNYHEYCNVYGCDATGYHEHDGTYCFGHNANDGHGHYYGGSHH